MSFPSAALTLLAVFLTAYAGSLIAAQPASVASWLWLITAVAAAMVCGAVVAVRRLGRTAVPEAGDDVTVEIEVRESLPPLRRSVSDWRPRVAATFPLALVALAGAGIYLTLDRSPAPALAVGVTTPPLAVVQAAVAPEVATPAPVATEALAEPATPRASKAVVRNVDPSLARRECLAQVESAYLFDGMARRAERPSAYARSTNVEIKQLARSRPVAPHTLQHIAQRMWERRHEAERAPAWWSAQYARCEEARRDGSSYVVRG